MTNRSNRPNQSRRAGRRVGPTIIGHLLAGLVLLLSGCTPSSFYEQYQVLDEQWSKEQEYYFTYTIDDNSVPYDLFVEIRNNNVYPYQNLWLFCLEDQPIGLQRRDTLECMLADDYGRWHGSGISIYHLSIPIRSGYHFPHRGQYTFAIRHGMRQQVLEGIEQIGLRIEKHTATQPE